MDLSKKWVDHLVGLPETGMSYQIVTVYLKNGEKREKMVIADSRNLCATLGNDEIDFFEDDIKDIKMS